MCLDCLDLIFITFKPPASRSRAYCDCNPIRAYETFDISKEPISKTSRFWMFWYKRGCNWLGAIKGMALWSRGFSLGSLFQTWPKPETAHEKPLAPRVKELWTRWKNPCRQLHVKSNHDIAIIVTSCCNPLLIEHTHEVSGKFNTWYICGGWRSRRWIIEYTKRIGTKAKFGA